MVRGGGARDKTIALLDAYLTSYVVLMLFLSNLILNVETND